MEIVGESEKNIKILELLYTEGFMLDRSNKYHKRKNKMTRGKLL